MTALVSCPDPSIPSCSYEGKPRLLYPAPYSNLAHSATDPVSVNITLKVETHDAKSL